MALTKYNMVRQVQEMGYTQDQSVEIIEALLEIMKSCLESGEDVLVSNFGKFRVKDKSSRRGRNPATGEDLQIDARKVVAFKCSGRLRDRINQG